MGIIIKTALKGVAFCAILLLGSAFFSGSAWAVVSGSCANCHTMHNSQDTSLVDADGPNDALLTDDCVGCHSATDSSTWKDPVIGAPIVYNTAAPNYGATTGDGKYAGLAGGNFYWVDQDHSNGHNIFSQDENLSQAPGHNVGCSLSCHITLTPNYYQTEAGQVCKGCHMKDDENFPGVEIHAHHTDDSDPNNVVDTEAKGWYRFLRGHMGGAGHGVAGIEDPDWEHNPTSSAHNEYFGLQDERKIMPGGFAWSGFTNRISAFCEGCHGYFHAQDTTFIGASPWIRHPSDAVIPNSGEYASMSTTYNPLVPVARPVLSSVSPTVTPGADLVFCLSCHRAHGSPYPDMLRWDYTTMEVGATGGAAGTGCFVCHTEKDGS